MKTSGARANAKALLRSRVSWRLAYLLKSPLLSVFCLWLNGDTWWDILSRKKKRKKKVPLGMPSSWGYLVFWTRETCGVLVNGHEGRGRVRLLYSHLRHSICPLTSAYTWGLDQHSKQSYEVLTSNLSFRGSVTVMYASSSMQSYPSWKTGLPSWVGFLHICSPHIFPQWWDSFHVVCPWMCVVLADQPLVLILWVIYNSFYTSWKLFS